MKTDDEILAQGAFAHNLLSNDAFNSIFKEYTDLSLAAIVSSQPHEVKAREFEYAKLQAMMGFATHLTGLAESAQHIINKNDPNIQSDED